MGQNGGDGSPSAVTLRAMVDKPGGRLTRDPAPWARSILAGGRISASPYGSSATGSSTIRAHGAHIRPWRHESPTCGRTRASISTELKTELCTRRAADSFSPVHEERGA